MNKLSSSDRSALLRLAASLPTGDESRRAILYGLSKAAAKVQKDLDESKPVIMSGLKGVKSTPGTKKFKNMDAFDKWAESEDAGNWTVQSVENA